MPSSKSLTRTAKISNERAIVAFRKIRASVKNQMSEDEVNDLVHEVRHERARRLRH